jgi:hypothetical protein
VALEMSRKVCCVACLPTNSVGLRATGPSKPTCSLAATTTEFELVVLHAQADETTWPHIASSGHEPPAHKHHLVQPSSSI